MLQKKPAASSGMQYSFTADFTLKEHDGSVIPLHYPETKYSVQFY
jgi:hypothetical protein